MTAQFDGLKHLLPEPASVLLDEELLRVYESDGLSAYRQLPACVVLPDTVDQVCAVMAYCHARNLPVVARGAGTGLSGGALPHPQGVLLSLAKFNRILSLVPEQRIARVQPGVTNLKISQAAAPFGLYYAPDPSSQIACTIGGNVAENSGGVHCLKYGLTVNNITALKVVTATGDLIELGGECPDAPGYDLVSLMTGSEGMLGVIIEVTVKLLPRPRFFRVLLAAFDRVCDAGDAVAEIIARGIIPAGLEMMDRACIQAVEAYVQAGYPTRAEAILLAELDGDEADVLEDTRRLSAIMSAHHATEVRVARDERESQQFWAGRKAAFPAVGRLTPDYYCIDGTIPRKQISNVLLRIGELSRQFGLRCVNVFHAGDGNLHPLILYDANVPGELQRVEAFGGHILEACVAAGGTITGEHGVGVEKLREMCVQFNSDEIGQFHALRSAFDESGLLNPGKAVPTLSRCAEFGAMHVHRGRLPFAELDRF